MRSNGYAVTFNELQQMVNENLLLLKTGQSIPANNKCMTGKEVNDRVWVYAGPSGTPAGENFLPLYNYFDPDLNLNVVAPSRNLLPKFEQINPIRAQSVLFEMNQEGNPYLNVDLGGYVNGTPLLLDPGSNLNFLFFGGPQYSPQMSPFVKVGNNVTVQANFGLASAESPGNFGWNAPGYGFLEVYANGTLISDQNIYKNQAYGPNLQSLTYTFKVQPSTNYYIKAYSLVTYVYNACYNTYTPSNACFSSNNLGYGCDNCNCVDC